MIAGALPDCPDFRWLARMLAIDGHPLRWTVVMSEPAHNVHLGAEVFCVGDGFAQSAQWRKRRDLRPDLNDPATIGCLLALVRLAYNDPTLTPSTDGSVWVIATYDPRTDTETVMAEECSEGEALAVALLARTDPRWRGPDGEMVRLRLVR